MASDLEQISGDVLDVSIRLHKRLGPGLLESVYETVLAAKLAQIGYDVARQRAIDIEVERLEIRSGVPDRPSRRRATARRDQIR